MSLVGFTICIVAAADAKQRLGEFASREIPEQHEIKVAREMHYLGIDWPPNGFVCMELIRAVAWAVSICLLILEYETHSTIETLLYVLFERGVRARSARISIIPHCHVSITSQEYNVHRSLIPQENQSK